MKKTNRVFQQFIIALCSLFISSACILFVPLVYNKSKATIICSVVFWVSLILGYTLIFLIHRKRTKNGRGKISIITFFRNPPAKVADAVLIISVVVVIAMGILKKQVGYGQYIIYFIIVFSFHMHSLFNSDTYRFIQGEVRRGKG